MRSISVGALLATLVTLSACAGDDGSTGGETSTSTASTTTDPTTGASATTAETAATTAAETMASASDSSSAGTTSSSTDATTMGSTDASSTGADGPPDYPNPADSCPDATAPVVVGNGQLCAPFCDGEGGACPDEGIGDATSSCEPFIAGNMGSGSSCAMGETCPVGEACDAALECHQILFWSCLLDCGPGGSCPAPMICTDQNRCAYPL